MLRFAEGFDFYRVDINDAKVKYLDINTSPSGETAFSAQFQSPGRWGGYSFKSDEYDYLWGTRSLGTQTRLTVGMAIRFSNPEDVALIKFLNEANQEQVTLKILKSGVTDNATLEVKAGSLSLAVTTEILLADEWHYVEFQADPHPTAGSFQVRVNEVIIMSDSNVNTADAGGTGASKVQFNCNSRNGAGDYFEIDDLYITDNQGSDNTSFLGDIVCEGLIPEADGFSTDWSASGGGDHFDEVDDVINPNGDTTYIEAEDVNFRDLFELNDPVVVTGSIAGVVSEIYARLVSPATDEEKVVRISGRHADTTNFSGNNVTIGDAGVYEFFSDAFDDNPVTGQPFTISDLKQLQLGIQIVS